MEPKDVADLFLSATEKIDFFWNFYVVMLIALIGWLVSRKEALPRGLKWLVSGGYLVFVAMNVVGLVGAYTFAEALRLDLLALPALAEDLAQTRAVLSAHSYEVQKQAVFWIHGLVGAGVLTAVWRSGRGSP